MGLFDIKPMKKSKKSKVKIVSFAPKASKRKHSKSIKPFKPMSFVAKPRQPKMKNLIFGYDRPKPSRKVTGKLGMSWPQAKKRFPKMNPLGDRDRDGVQNFLDCRPFDKKRQSKMFRKEIEKNILIEEEDMEYPSRAFKASETKRKKLQARFEKTGSTTFDKPMKKLTTKKDIITYFEKNPDRYSEHLKLQKEMKKINYHERTPKIILTSNRNREQSAGSYERGGDIKIPILQDIKHDLGRTIGHELIGHGGQDIDNTLKELQSQSKKPVRKLKPGMRVLPKGLSVNSRDGWSPTMSLNPKTNKYEVLIKEGDTFSEDYRRVKKWGDRPIEIDAEKRRKENPPTRKLKLKESPETLRELDLNNEVKEPFEIVSPVKKKITGWGNVSTVPVVDHPKSYGYVSKKVRMTPKQFMALSQKTSRDEEIRKLDLEEYKKRTVTDYQRDRNEGIEILTKNLNRKPTKKEIDDLEEYKVVKTKRMEKLKNVLKDEKGEMDLGYIEYDEEGKPEAHEGRHRAVAAEEVGQEEIPVVLIKKGKEEPEEWNEYEAFEDEPYTDINKNNIQEGEEEVELDEEDKE